MSKYFSNEELAQRVRTHGGFSVGSAGTDVSATPAYLVCTKPHSSIIVEGFPRVDEIVFFKEKFYKEIRDGKVLFGAWYDKRTQVTWLELTEAVEDRATAEALARRHGQQFIWCGFTQQCLPVKLG